MSSTTTNSFRSEIWPTLGPHIPQAPSDEELDKISHNVPRFEPTPGIPHDTQAYLNDIDFYLRRFPNASVHDKFYLIKVTSSREVSRFIERQVDHIRNDYQLLCQTLEREFSDELTQSGLSAAMIVKQGRNELPQQYYYRLLKAYFGFRNEVGMEEDMSF